MLELETKQTVPLAVDENGVIRVTDSRVTLDSIVNEFRRGATAEQIQENFPSLGLREIYGAIAYYLEHTESVEGYLRRQEPAATQTRREIEKSQTSAGLRERLRQRRALLEK